MVTRYLDNNYINVAIMCLMFIGMSVLLPPYLILKFIYQNTLLRHHAKEENMKGKVVLITGASSGIEEYMAYEYAKRGACLVVVARREDRLHQVANKARQLGSHDVLLLTADVSNINDCKRFVDETTSHFGRLDHLVNNAGISNTYLVHDREVEVTKFAPVMDINFWGSIYPTYYAIPHLKKTKGKIVVNSSAAAFLFPPQTAFYSASKSALFGFFESLRVELSPDITITIVILGYVESEMTQGKALTHKGVVGVSQVTNVVEKGYPVMSTEPCAKAIVDGACRGEKYASQPKYVKPLMLLNFLTPELVQWFYRNYFLTNSSKTD